VQGFTTIHAGSARQALTRLRFICQLSDAAGELPMSALNTLVAEAVDVVVHCVRTPNGPRLSSIVAVEDLAGGADNVQFTTTELFARVSSDRPLTWTGHVPVRLARAFGEAGFDLRALLGATPATIGTRT
jgi:pilus assembly protein CpaF